MSDNGSLCPATVAATRGTPPVPLLVGWNGTEFIATTTRGLVLHPVQRVPGPPDTPPTAPDPVPPGGPDPGGGGLPDPVPVPDPVPDPVPVPEPPEPGL